MGKNIKKYFLEQLNKTNDVSKEDIINLAQECGIELKKRISKEKVINLIVEHGYYDKLFEYFNEFVKVPSWEVADYYHMTSKEINSLRYIGVIKEEVEEKGFYSRNNKEYFTAFMYPLTVFDYEEEELKRAYDNAYGGNTYALRIETRTNEEVKQLISILSKVFKIEKAPATYEHRNDRGQYTYLKVKLLNDTEAEENKFLKEIEELNNEIKQLEQKNNEYARELKRYKNLDRIEEPSKKNARNAGRKPKFNKEEIIGMEIMKENGYTYEQIAEEYKTSKVTVIKYIKKKT
ncbi:MAG: helix-turn-helix domain-containing protein [Clostridium sp.]